MGLQWPPIFSGKVRPFFCSKGYDLSSLGKESDVFVHLCVILTTLIIEASIM